MSEEKKTEARWGILALVEHKGGMRPRFFAGTTARFATSSDLMLDQDDMVGLLWVDDVPQAQRFPFDSARGVIETLSTKLKCWTVLLDGTLNQGQA